MHSGRRGGNQLQSRDCGISCERVFEEGGGCPRMLSGAGFGVRR